MNCEKNAGIIKTVEGSVIDVDDSVREHGPEKCDECPICYQEFAYKTELPDCGHKFCFLCIKGLFPVFFFARFTETFMISIR